MLYLDVVVNDLDGPPMVLLNEGGNRVNWIRLKLEGPKKNPFGIGARVKVTAGDPTQKSEVRSGGSYISQNDLRLHFGMGDRKLADLVEVTWPDGTVTRIENVPVNQEIKVAAEER